MFFKKVSFAFSLFNKGSLISFPRSVLAWALRIKTTIYPFYLFTRVTCRRGNIFCHILPYQKVSFCYDKLVELIGIACENSDGAKRTRTADPLHAMQVLYQLSYGPKSLNVFDINRSLDFT